MWGAACLTATALRPHEVAVATSLHHAEVFLEHAPFDVIVFDPATDGGLDFLLLLSGRHPKGRRVAYTLSREAERRGAFGTAHVTLAKPASTEALRRAVLGGSDTREFKTLDPAG